MSKAMPESAGDQRVHHPVNLRVLLGFFLNVLVTIMFAVAAYVSLDWRMTARVQTS